LHDSPTSAEILAAAAGLLREQLIPALPPEQAFAARVMANALDLARRELAQDPAIATDLSARLAALVGTSGDDQALTARLAERIDQGAMAPDDPGLIDYLWRSTLARIAVDQPGYASFLAETRGTEHL